TRACGSSRRERRANGSSSWRATEGKAMSEQGMRFRLGVFVLGSIVLMAVLIMLFARMPAAFKPHDQYTIIFTQASGVAQGTPVRRSGVRIGQVQSVELDNATGLVRVTILIERPYILYEDDQPVLVQGM